jgi:hypothetical protein
MELLQTKTMLALPKYQSDTNFWIAEWDDKEEGNEALQQWEDDWDDDDVNDDFSLQLRKELESNASKN